jgi:hypothetical protein
VLVENHPTLFPSTGYNRSSRFAESQRNESAMRKLTPLTLRPHLFKVVRAAAILKDDPPAQHSMDWQKEKLCDTTKR